MFRKLNTSVCVEIYLIIKIHYAVLIIRFTLNNMTRACKTSRIIVTEREYKLKIYYFYIPLLFIKMV